MRKRTGAIVLAGGRGSRMKSSVPKQYMEVAGFPLLYYALKAFEDSDEIDEIIVVAGAKDIDYCRCSIVEKYGFKKVKSIVEGGNERYNSVYNGLCALKDIDYVLIHDGARPMVSERIIHSNIEAVCKYKACVTAVQSKDTVKLSRADKTVKETPDRTNVWLAQTPQTFSYELIKEAYDKLMADETSHTITDDAMVVETFTNKPVYLVDGTYENIKVTTPKDLMVIQHFVGEQTN